MFCIGSLIIIIIATTSSVPAKSVEDKDLDIAPSLNYT